MKYTIEMRYDQPDLMHNDRCCLLGQHFLTPVVVYGRSPVAPVTVTFAYIANYEVIWNHIE